MTLHSKTASACWWLALGILAFGSKPCLGAKPFQPVYGDPLLEPWRWRTFPELSGLDVQCMADGADGTMWFGTYNGLWSYDGFDWDRHSTNEVADRFVTALCIEPNGSVYVGGERGISQFSQGNWTRLISASGSRFAAIRRFTTGPDGSLWAATSWGALQHRQSAWTLYTDADTAGRLRQDESVPFLSRELLPETVAVRLGSGSLPANRCDLTEVCADGQGRIWFGTAGGQVLRYAPAPTNASPIAAGGTWSIYDESDGLAAGVVTSILPLQDGTVWVAHAASESASVLDGRAWRTMRLPVFIPALGFGETGGKLLQTRDGVVWLSALYALYAYRDGQWRKYGQPEVPYPSIRNVVTQSADGALWFAGPNHELHRVDYQTPRWLTLHDLNFQWESPAGAQWFLHRDGRVVVHDASRWTSYGVEDGLMDAPVALLGTRRGEVWAAGSHEHTATGRPERTAATARFDGQKWTRHLHDDLAWGIDWRGVFESSDGSVWFGAFVDTDGPAQHRDGILQYRDGVWTHHHQPGRSPRAGGVENPATLLPASPSPDRPIEKFICLGESRDRKLWAGRSILAFHNGTKWTEFLPTPELRPGVIETMLTTREGDLWIGTRESGAWRYDGHDWRQFQGRDSLVANSVRSLAQTDDGSIWAATDRGSSRFDGRSWMGEVLPEPLNFAHESGSLKASPSSGLWINHYTLYWMRRGWTKSPPPDPQAEFQTVCHQFRGQPPRTSITAGAGLVSQPGNLAVLWSGAVPWREPKDARLQFSFRLDDQPWSAYTSDSGHSFFTLPDGRHRLQVRARDQDFNVDPTPATLDFVVLPPVWRQAWFLLLIVLLGGLVIAQSIRVLMEQGRLRQAHAELEERVRQRTAELESANRELQTFSYSVSHDLRAPLRSIDGFSQALLDDYGEKLDEEGRGHLHRVRSAAQRMGQLIDDMLRLARINRSEMRWSEVNLSQMAEQVAAELKQGEPARQVEFAIAPGCVVHGDAALLRIVLENVLGNAWKYTGKKPSARIEFGVQGTPDGPAYFVRDNGCGFDMKYVHRLFGAFQRLHDTSQYPGTGVGLASVQRVIHRHGGRVWIEGKVDEGTTLHFTLPRHKTAPQNVSG